MPRGYVDAASLSFIKLEGEFRDCPQEEIRSSGCAIQQQQPCCLHVWDLRDHLEQSVVLQPFLDQEVLNVRVCTLRPCWAAGNPWSPRHTAACGLCIRAPADGPAAPVGSMPSAFHLVLPKWMLMPARLRSSLSNNWNTSCTLVGLQITCTYVIQECEEFLILVQLRHTQHSVSTKAEYHLYSPPSPW